jgi:uncharacterized protein YdbL (DUF1318 family)
MKRPVLPLLIALFLFNAFAGAVSAESEADAAQRIKERLAQIDTLKGSGDVGEAASGYLEARAELGPRQRAIIEAENADRRIVYAAVAERTGQTVEDVGQQRALRIAELARPGVWLQSPGGDWYRKR